MGSLSHYPSILSGLQAQAEKQNELYSCTFMVEQLIWAGTVNPTMPVSTGPNTPVQMSCNVYFITMRLRGNIPFRLYCKSDTIQILFNAFGIFKPHKRGPVCCHQFLLVFTMLLRAEFGKGPKLVSTVRMVSQTAQVLSEFLVLW